ncbi:ROK family protein [Auraticoccus sp. F435]|uniref:ROK family protein n=1 Tax=Auraticoccus cholistanensis TaxID=2656650 RepID=A0A6A9UQT6_9ACTN|nr:ROK family transcriptional regulator [Auraticoccus cholistanensis]MVA75266.1 ROK family protein [Auraticoccus cholistanensis]
MPADSGLQALRRGHEQRVVDALRVSGPLSRAQLAERVGLSRATISEITADLQSRAVLVVVEESAAHRLAPARSGRGRPAQRLALNPLSGQLVGVDFGHRRVHVVVVDASHEVVASGARSYAGDSDWPTRVDRAFALLDELAEDDRVELAGVQAVSIGFPGPFSPRLPAPPPGDTEPAETSSDFVRARFGERFGVPVMVDNNTRFAALAEAIWGSGAETGDLLYVRLADGVGGGLVVQGRLVTGSAGFAGELGHISVRLDGPDCRCGKRGCLETIASVPSLLARCEEEGVRVSTLAELAEAVGRADPVVDRILRDAGEALGRVLGTLAVALNPAEVVVGGEVVHLAPALLAQAQATISWELLPMPQVAPTIRTAQLGDEDGALGAVAAVLHSSPLLASYPELSPPPPPPPGTDRDAS